MNEKTDEEVKAEALKEFAESLYKYSRRSLRRSLTSNKFSDHIRRSIRDQNLSNDHIPTGR